jgi:hypothetical protein
MIDAQESEWVRGNPWVVRLVGTGALFVVVGIVGGLYALRSAALDSYVASQPKAMTFTPPQSNSVGANIGLQFDPSSAHYVAPDYTVFWVWMLVVALGLILVVAGMAVALARRRLVD